MVICQTMSGQPYAVAPERLVFRPSVYAIIPHATTIVLMTLRTTGKYGLPGGAVEPHEALEQALHREVREETGLTVVIERLLHFKETFFYYEPGDRAYHTLSFFYRCHPQTLTLLTDDQVNDGAFPEATCPRWIDPSRISPHDIQGFFRDELFAVLPTLQSPADSGTVNSATQHGTQADQPNRGHFHRPDALKRLFDRQSPSAGWLSAGVRR